MRESKGELLWLRKSELKRVVPRMPFGLLQVLIKVAEFFNLLEKYSAILTSSMFNTSI